ncbi:hypothetical protein I317_02302 [Kwoniella heveanensis CBS 569]|nr:hypothetical protein I317_02302 [Kwoniella heveanensis CBS 569]
MSTGTTITTKNGDTTRASADTWVYDHLHQVYFHPSSNTYAIPDSKTGEWSYVPAAQFHAASSSSKGTRTGSGAISHERSRGSGDGDDVADANSRVKERDEEKEEGEIEDDVGWGGLMEPDKLAEIEREQARSKQAAAGGGSNMSGSGPLAGLEKHPAYGGISSTSATVSARGINRDTVVPYDDPKLYAYPSNTADDLSLNNGTGPDMAAEDHTLALKETPNHILRLVVLASDCLEKGQVALIDTREGGIQVGRDRCERGGTPRIRCREMRVSKTHAVIYWGGDNDSQGTAAEGWWIVDLGSTHGTFISRSLSDSTADPSVGEIQDTPSGNRSQSRPRSKSHRLSEPKHSSKPYPLTHLSRLIIGSTTFEVHLHASTSWPCEACQVGKENKREIPLDDGEPKAMSTTTPGNKESEAGAGQGDEFRSDVAGQRWAMDSKQKRENRELKRKREMALLRETLLNRDSPSSAPSSRSEGSGKNQMNDNTGVDVVSAGTRATPPSPKRAYLDRSAMRRRLHPPSPPSRGKSPGSAHVMNNPNSIAVPAKTAYGASASSSGNSHGTRTGNGTSTTTSATMGTALTTGVSSVASFILASQGWIPGQGLGKDRSGRADPVQAEMRNARAGLGAKGGIAYSSPILSGLKAGVGAGEVADEKMDWKTRAKMRRWNEVSKGP